MCVCETVCACTHVCFGARVCVFVCLYRQPRASFQPFSGLLNILLHVTSPDLARGSSATDRTQGCQTSLIRGSMASNPSVFLQSAVRLRWLPLGHWVSARAGRAVDLAHWCLAGESASALESQARLQEITLIGLTQAIVPTTRVTWLGTEGANWLPLS